MDTRPRALAPSLSSSAPNQSVLLHRLLVLACLLFASFTAAAQGGWCNNNFDIPDGVDLCPDASVSLDWWAWYDDSGNDPDLQEALWISPSGDTTALEVDAPFLLSGNMEAGTWTVYFDLSNQGPQPNDCTFDFELSILPAPSANFSVINEMLRASCDDISLAIF